MNVSYVKTKKNKLKDVPLKDGQIIVTIDESGGSGGGSGGHTIITSSNLPMAGRSNLQFDGAILSDDENNDTTIVRIPTTTFNGRSGSILPTAGDYNATQIDYDANQTVKDKIDSINVGVTSFNGRSGSILPVNGDYNAEQINYDNNTSVKQKIDNLVTGVSSFNGRSGSILPTAGDYSAEDITYGQSTVKDALDNIGNSVVSSFNGRNGSILPIAGDYSDDKIILSSTMHIGGGTQTNVSEALNALANNIEIPVPISKGGTGNADGYIRTGKASNTTAAEASTIEGVNNTVEGKNSHAEGNSNTVNKITDYPNADLSCHVEGYSNTMTAQYSHAEGANNTVTGATAHAEGMNNTVSQQGAHAEGRNNTASGYYSHAEGAYNTASSYQTHVSGSHNVAAYENQTVIGTYNSNKSNTLFEVGNGNSENETENRSNAFEVYADGHVNAPGGFYKNGTELVTGVSSFKGRTGAITPIAGDYDATQVSYSSGTSVKQKIDNVAGVWTTVVSCLTGDTDVTINNANIHTTSVIDIYYENSSGTPVFYKNTTVTEGRLVITFESELTESVNIKLKIIN